MTTTLPATNVLLEASGIVKTYGAANTVIRISH